MQSAAVKRTGTFVVEENRLEWAKWQVPASSTDGAARVAAGARAPTLVLLHEGLGCVELWRDFPERLCVASGLDVLAYSRAGYGGSDAVPLPRKSTYMHDEAIRVLPAVLEEAGIEDAVLVGHSDGGTIALAACSGQAVNRIRAIVTVAAHVFTEEISVASIRAAGKAFLEGDLRERLRPYHGDRVDCAFYGWHDAWLAPDFIHWSIADLLPAVAVPVLVVQGADDDYGTLAQVESIERGCTGPVRTRVFDNGGHALHRTHADLLIGELRSFLARHLAI